MQGFDGFLQRPDEICRQMPSTAEADGIVFGLREIEGQRRRAGTLAERLQF